LPALPHFRTEAHVLPVRPLHSNNQSVTFLAKCQYRSFRIVC